MPNFNPLEAKIFAVDSCKGVHVLDVARRELKEGQCIDSLREHVSGLFTLDLHQEIIGIVTGRHHLTEDTATTDFRTSSLRPVPDALPALRSSRVMVSREAP
ncbi:MAG: hypothetical protein WCG85_00340 [Polyangia bacterium]